MILEKRGDAISRKKIFELHFLKKETKRLEGESWKEST